MMNALQRQFLLKQLAEVDQEIPTWQHQAEDQPDNTTVAQTLDEFVRLAAALRASLAVGGRPFGSKGGRG